MKIIRECSKKTLIIKKFLHGYTKLIIIFVVCAGFCISEYTGSAESNSRGRENHIFDKNKTDTVRKKYKLPEDAFLLHYDALVADTHNDFLEKVFSHKARFGSEDSFTQSGLPRLLKGGVKVQFFACWIPETQFDVSKEYVLQEIEILKSFEKEEQDKFAIATTADDIGKINSEGKLAGMIGIEGGTALEGNIDNIDLFYSKDVRYITLTWNNSNDIGSSAKDEEKGKGNGLTDFGKKVVRRMNEVGMLVDVSHLGEKSFWDVVSISDKPILASHSCCSAINPIPRNLTDEQIKAIAKSGGVIMINFYSSFLKKDAPKKFQTADKIYAKELKEIYDKYGSDKIKYNEERYKFLQSHKPKGNIATLDDVIGNIEHVINLAGVDYVGIGSDFDGGINPPFDLYDATCYPFITMKLAEKGYRESDIRKILGLNLMRILNPIQK